MISYIGGVTLVVFSFNLFTPKDDHKGMHWIVIKFEYVFEYSNIVHKNLKIISN
jgi:hypothetical protein